MQYMLLINTDPSAWESMTPEQQQAGIELYRAYTGELESAGVLVAGDQLMPAATAKQVRSQNGSPFITDGPFAETKETLGGYYLVDCAGLDEALDIAARIPSVRHGSIEVRPVVQH